MEYEQEQLYEVASLSHNLDPKNRLVSNFPDREDQLGGTVRERSKREWGSQSPFWVGLTVLGHLLEHVPKYVPAKHVLARYVLEQVLGLKQYYIFPVKKMLVR